jgi:hypothetical protein
MANLGSRNISQGDVRRLVFDYTDFMGQGFDITSVTAAIVPATSTSTVGPQNPQIWPTEKGFWVWITGGSQLNEQFTLNLVVKDNFAEVLNDTVNFTVTAPGAT